MAAILVFQNKETAAILVSQTSPFGVELYFYAKIVFCSSIPIWRLVTWVKTLYTPRKFHQTKSPFYRIKKTTRVWNGLWFHLFLFILHLSLWGKHTLSTPYKSSPAKIFLPKISSAKNFKIQKSPKWQFQPPPQKSSCTSLSLIYQSTPPPWLSVSW